MASRWLIILSLLLSALLLGITGWHAWDWHRVNDQMLSRRLQSINRVFTPSLAEAAQNEDIARVHQLLDRLTDDPAIVNATLRDDSGASRDFTGSAPPAPLATLPATPMSWHEDGMQRWIQPLGDFLALSSSRSYWLDLTLDPSRASKYSQSPLPALMPMLSLLLLIPAALAWRRSARAARHARSTPESDQATLAGNAEPLPTAREESNLTYMSHELRAPLSGLLGFCRLLENSPLDAQQREWLRHIHLASNGLLDTVDHVLGDPRRCRTNNVFDIAEVLWEVLCLQTPLAQAKRITLLAIVYDDVPPRLIGADIAVRQLLTNLVNNAIKYGGEGDVVTRIVLENREGSAVKLRLSVSDGGNATPANRERLRRLIAQGETRSANAEDGVGLAICHRLAAEMNGSLALGERRGGSQTIVSRLGFEACEPYVRPAEFDLGGARIGMWQPHTRLAHLLDYALRRWHALPRVIATADSLPSADDTSQLLIIGIDDNALAPATRDLWQQRFDAIPQPCLVIANLAPTKALDWRLPKGSVVLRLPISRYMLGRTLAKMLAESRQRAMPPRPRVLVVDDDEVSQHYLDAVLPIIGAKVVVAGTAAEAVAIASETSIDLVLMDLHLPDANGFEAANLLRRLSADWARTPVVAMTAGRDAHGHDVVTNDEVAEVLTKPLDERLLREVLARYLPLAESPNTEPQSDTARITPDIAEPGQAGEEADLPAPNSLAHAGDLPVVDKAQARERSGGREALVVELMTLLIAELPRHRQDLHVAWQRRDVALLRERVHQLGGGCRYCGVPQLAAACDELERRCGHGAIDECEEAFRELIAACDRLTLWAEDQAMTDIN
ncbi:response regulator [Salinicola acroporae]|uniref:response regulator n=1 Tax=Salinicola acroporae TaxID=1541440 RepID=UPI0013A62E02|nr:response regulator [Salinicola acroporae]